MPQPAPAQPPAKPAGSQTLDRGLLALELLADAERPLTINELATGLGVHRSNAYRVLRTLEHRRFVSRDDAGLIRLGAKLTSLARGVAPALHTAATPAITELAHRLGVTAFLTVLDADEVVTLVAVEPASAAAAIARSPGVRHPVSLGAPGHAIEAALSAAEHAALFGGAPLSAAAAAAQRAGYAISQSEVIAGVTSLAVPLRLPSEPAAAIAIVHFAAPESIPQTVALLHAAAAQIRAAAH